MLLVSREDWLNRYDKPKTRKQAEIVLNSFDVFLMENNLTESELIKTMSLGETKYYVIQKYVNFLKSKGNSPTTINNYFVFLRSYLRYNGIKTDRDDLKDLVRFPKILKEIRTAIDKPILRTLIDNSPRKYQPLWLVLSSSGMRISEALAVDYSSEIIKIPANITKTASGREVFISNEARQYLIDDKFDFTINDVEQIFKTIRKRSGLVQKYSTGFYQVNIHSLRAYFFTKASLKHGSDYAHAMIGHGAYLNQYFRIPLDTRIKMYKELEPSLEIFT